MSRKGFTLVELLAVIAISIIVMLAIYATMEMGQHSSGVTGRRVVTQQDTRSVLDLMTMEIRMASYAPAGWGTATGQVNPQAFNPAVNPPCNNGTGGGTPLNKGIQWADANSIAIEMDLNTDTLIDITKVGAANELIYYSYVVDNANNGIGHIARQVGCNGPLTPILGGVGAETEIVNSIKTRPAVDPNPTPLFRYFDNTDTDITNAIAADQTNIKNIRRIEITIVADTAYTDPQMQSVNRMIYSTSFILRNHVLN
jgi:prepilin-type N-terminal cleavage/methylation domain-containing protein